MTHKELEGNHTSDPTFVLVPGAWHGAHSWDRVSSSLTSLGRQSVSVELPSNGVTPTRLGAFEDDVEAVMASCVGIDRVVLVGHSYGATVASVGASRLREAFGIVSVAGLLPDLEESTTTLILRGRTAAAAQAVEVHDEGYISVKPQYARDVLYGQCSESVARQAVSDLRLQSSSSVRHRVREVGWRAVPTTYVVCEKDRFIDPIFQREHASEREASVVSLKADHCPMLSSPDELAVALIETGHLIASSI